MKRLRLLGKGIEPEPEPAMTQIIESKPIPKQNIRLINTLSKIDINNKKNKFIKF